MSSEKISPRVPDVVFGALLTIAVFCVGVVSITEYRVPGIRGEESQAFALAWWLKDATGFLTIFLVLIGFGQALLFLWQLILMRKSLQDAQIAASSAASAASAAQKQIQLAYRPFVGVDRTTVSSISQSNNSISVEIRVSFKNVGTFPARGLKVYPKLVIGGLPTSGKEAAIAIDDDFINETPSFRRSLMEGDMILPHGATFDRPLRMCAPLRADGQARDGWIMIAIAYWGQEREDDGTPKAHLGTFAYELVQGPSPRLVPLYGISAGTT
ncbi:hypothetical protein [Bradyrhizobium sp. Ghvi]|uniref:hypothetical protein n=1 Tax=Bradyrhizobium sp. Ghvi TaxID=1855319 RepID=UPI00117867D1|nr:hypothetical protein [Bradyrhizobium sp. Ghvi]